MYFLRPCASGQGCVITLTQINRGVRQTAVNPYFQALGLEGYVPRRVMSSYADSYEPRYNSEAWDNPMAWENPLAWEDENYFEAPHFRESGYLQVDEYKY